MALKEDIIIIEKTEEISWSDIQKVLWESHKENRDNGIVMKHQSLSGEEIKELIGDEGIMFVAKYGDEIAGTAALKFKEVSFWFGKVKCAYRCFGCVLPKYQGLGIYKRVSEHVETVSKDKGYYMMTLNTHLRNKRVIGISESNGYKKVKYTSDHVYKYVYLVKWLDGCPFSDLRCQYEYIKQKSVYVIKRWIKRHLFNIDN